MKIVIIGLGNIGATILDSISRDDHEIMIIDDDKNVVERLIERYDVLGVVGNGACLNIQNEANVSDADLVLALTTNDEINILSCMVAKNAGAKNTIARVRNPEYTEQMAKMKDELGLSMIVNPEEDTANEIFNLINLPSVEKIEYFAKGRVSLVEIKVEKGSSLIGESLVSLGKKLQNKVLICAVQRQDEVIIPSGNFEIMENDIINFTADASKLASFLAEAKLEKTPIKNVMIVGGGKTGFYLASKLSKNRYRIKMIENDKRKANELAENLEHVSLINGDGTDHDILIEEGIELIDAFVTLTGNDEENIIASLFAKNLKVKKVITQVKKSGLIKMTKDYGINNNVAPTNVVANRVISYIRAIENTRGSNIITLYRLVNDQVEALEFISKKEEFFINKPLKELNIKDNCLIACIIRNDEVIIPNGNDSIMLNDDVVVVTTHKNFDDLMDVFSR